MIEYFCPPSTEGVREAIRAGRLGMSAAPRSGGPMMAGVRTMFDNGCYGGHYIGDEKFLRWLERRAAEGPDRYFAVCPDVPFDAVATLKRLGELGTQIRELGYPVALAAQNGQEDIELPWDDFDVLFIAGDTDWKLGPHAARLTRAARERGYPVHMGRVNSIMRLQYARAIGCTSADGTFMVHAPSANLEKMLRWLAGGPKAVLRGSGWLEVPV